MTQINEDFLNRIVRDVIPSEKEIPNDINHPEFSKRVIENAPNTLPQYFEYDADRAIRNFLFEHTDIAKELKKMIEELGKKGYKDERKGK